MASKKLSSASVPAAMTRTSSSKGTKASTRVVYLAGMNSYSGLKAQNTVVGLGMPVCTEQCFANVFSLLRSSGKKGRSGGALSSTGNAAAEIFRIAAIMNGLVLVGVAVGFMLLRVEASLEEVESS